MFLGLWTLGATLAAHVQLKNGNSPVTADAGTITGRIYAGDSETQVGTVTVTSTVTDSLTGWHKLSAALTSGNGFARGVYTLRLAYQVSAVNKCQEYSLQIV